MSFQLLKEKIINLDDCTGCRICEKSCKNIKMVDSKPVLVDQCFVDKGYACGNCYSYCPEVKKKGLKKYLSEIKINNSTSAT